MAAEATPTPTTAELVWNTAKEAALAVLNRNATSSAVPTQTAPAPNSPPAKTGFLANLTQTQIIVVGVAVLVALVLIFRR